MFLSEYLRRLCVFFEIGNACSERLIYISKVESGLHSTFISNNNNFSVVSNEVGCVAQLQ